MIPLSNPDQLTMFKKRQIDGAWTIEPWMARLEIEGGGELFLEEKSLWPEGRYVTTHLVVSKSYLVKNRRVIHDLLAALIEVTGRINLDKTAAGLVLNAQLKKETGKVLKDEVIERAMSRVEFTWDPICASLQRSAEAAHRIGFIRQTPALGGIYSLHCLNTVLEEKGMPPVPGPSH